MDSFRSSLRPLNRTQQPQWGETAGVVTAVAAEAEAMGVAADQLGWVLAADLPWHFELPAAAGRVSGLARS